MCDRHVHDRHEEQLHSGIGDLRHWLLAVQVFVVRFFVPLFEWLSPGSTAVADAFGSRCGIQEAER